MKAISVKLPDPLRNAIVKAAKQRSVSQSDIVRTALTNYFVNHAEQYPSAAAQALRWAGLGRCNPDLSNNPVHFKGFGQSKPTSV